MSRVCSVGVMFCLIYVWLFDVCVICVVCE